MTKVKIIMKMAVSLPDLGLIKAIVKTALDEDIGSGDITTQATIEESRQARAAIVTKAKGVIAGLRVGEMVFKAVDEEIIYNALVEEGALVNPGDKIIELEGPARSILTAERTALNFLQHLSGIATKTRKLIDLVKGYRVKIMDTRKTIPGLRLLEKYAVRVGGGHNHRLGLYDGVLIKDNHIRLVGSIKKAVKSAKCKVRSGIKIEVEATTLAQVEEALAAGADIIMLDNMDLETMRAAVKLIAGRAQVEASGGIDEENVAEVAGTGVDFISIGALTHTVQALDMSLEVESPKANKTSTK